MINTIHHTSVLFASPYWIVFFERIENEKYSVARIVIGTSEPEYAEISEFLFNIDLQNIEYTVPITGKEKEKKLGFKKEQKRKQKMLSGGGLKHVFTKAQGLLKAQMEQRQEERKRRSREEKEEIKQRKFSIRQSRKKDKHKGH